MSESKNVRTRPAFEKLLIGPAMVFGECITGGHYLEVLRLGKQMTVGHSSGPSYWRLHTANVSEWGFFGAFYRGFLPWGLIQCGKGIPVLFVHHESMYHLQHKMGWTPGAAEKASGFLGGCAQGMFMNPFQKIKVTVVACEQMNSMSPSQAFRRVIHLHGVSSLLDGLLPMMVRRSLDWGIRFSVSSEVKHCVIRQKQAANMDTELTAAELIFCGLVGGAFSALTHPIDNVVTNCMKPMPENPTAPKDIISVVRRMYAESGIRAFTRGWGIKVVDNSYHMAWMYGIGNVVYRWVDQAMKSSQHC